MALSEIKRLLRQSTGLESSLIGASAIERAVRERMRANELSDVGAYRDLARESTAELHALIDLVVVAETSFFRDARAYDTLARFIKEDWPRSPARPFRMLSLPCSTGEEPYLMAMTAIDAGLPIGGFQVDAVDICKRSLEHARIGTYADAAFRGGAADIRRRHFARTVAGWNVSDRVRNHVHFLSGNLLGALPLPAAEPYDIVFCRNLLIYFDSASQEKAIDVVDRLLAPDGMLFVGSAETVAFINRGFIPEQTPKAFAFRKVGGVGNTLARPARVAQPQLVSHAEVSAARRQDSACGIAAAIDRSDRSAPAVALTPALDEGRRLADEGRFEEAVRSCEASVRRHGPSAEALHLLGLICDAEGHVVEAMKCYQQAIYLNPHHEDSLAHLALLLDAQDRKQEAQRLRIRARRAAERSAP